MGTCRTRRSLLFATVLIACRPSAAHDAPAPPVEATELSVDRGPSELDPLQVAITVDDLPAHGPTIDGLTRLAVHQALLAAFASHEVPQVYGFVNAQSLERAPELRAPLEAWVAAGHPLGNHTYSHPSLREIGLDDYFADIAQNEPTLDALAPGGVRTPTFRYPYLLEGMSREDTLAIRAHLDERGYRDAPVTIDFYDWAFNAAFARCTAAGNSRAVQAIEKTYMAHAMEMLAWSDAAAQALYGRRIPHVLLIHAGAINAGLIEPLLDAMEAEGVEWISLDDALADPVYAETYVHEGRNQGTLLDQKIDTEGGEHPPRHTHPRALLEAMCTESAP
ncbi:MAG: polysaccharide deacetylase family protein [Nannocystaceae bacterium]|nr:polysaccharide deacetylase family protein [bacterium]